MYIRARKSAQVQRPIDHIAWAFLGFCALRQLYLFSPVLKWLSMQLSSFPGWREIIIFLREISGVFRYSSCLVFLAAPEENHLVGTYHGREREKHEYRSYSNKRRGAY